MPKVVMIIKCILHHSFKNNVGWAFFYFFLICFHYPIKPQDAALPLPIPAPTESAAIPEPSQTIGVPPVPQADGSSQPSNGPETIAINTEKTGIQGNWLKKKEWLLKSNEVFEEIQNNVLEIQGTRKMFNEKYQTMDDEFDAFYKDLGADQGKIQELFESISRYLDKKKKKDLAALTNDETTQEHDKDYLAKIDLLEATVKKNKDALEQLKLDIKSIEDLDKSVTERLKKVDEQTTQTQEEFNKAQALVADLWDIIDDKKARTIYYELKGNYDEKIKGILSYLKDELFKDFEGTIEKARTQITKIKNEIKQLEEKGFIIKDRSKRVEQLKLQELKQLEEAKKTAANVKVKEEEFDIKKGKKTLTWYEQIYDYILLSFSKTYQFFTSFFQTKPLKTTKKVSVDPQITPLPNATQNQAMNIPQQPPLQQTAPPTPMATPPNPQQLEQARPTQNQTTSLPLALPPTTNIP